MKEPRQTDKPGTVKQVTRYVRANGFPSWELVAGKGYFYFASDQGTISVMSYRLRSLTYGQWLNELQIGWESTSNPK